MGMAIAALVVGIAILYMVFAGDKKSEEYNRRTSSGISVSVTQGSEKEYKYPIKGINMYNCDRTFVGPFTGYVKALTGNSHDKYAISVYVKGKKVGFLPRGCSQMHQAIIDNGGTADCIGEIHEGKGEDGRTFFYGGLDVLI